MTSVQKPHEPLEHIHEQTGARTGQAAMLAAVWSQDWSGLSSHSKGVQKFSFKHERKRASRDFTKCNIFLVLLFHCVYDPLEGTLRMTKWLFALDFSFNFCLSKWQKSVYVQILNFWGSCLNANCFSLQRSILIKFFKKSSPLNLNF